MIPPRRRPSPTVIYRRITIHYLPRKREKKRKKGNRGRVVTSFTSRFDLVGHGEYLTGGIRTKSHDEPPLSALLSFSSFANPIGHLDDPRRLTYPSAAMLGPRCTTMANERNDQASERERELQEEEGGGREGKVQERYVGTSDSICGLSL